MILEFLPPNAVGQLSWLGKQKGWIAFKPQSSADGIPLTAIKIDLNRLATAPKELFDTLINLWKQRNWAAIALLEIGAVLAADGPKQFLPTEEQFEAMEQVELRIPVADFSAPFPALVVRIPPGARTRLAKQCDVPLDTAPKSISVRWRHETGEPSMIITHSGQPGTQQEFFYLFQDQPGNETIEKALARDVNRINGGDSSTGLFLFGHVVARAALNLCLMLTHYGCDVQQPPRRNRKERREHTKHGDCATVTMRQNVVIRTPSPPTNNPPGTGTGIEVKPHWRKGHWRCYPGKAAERAAGTKVPLLFVRPCLVREDRVVGELGESSVIYHG